METDFVLVRTRLPREKKLSKQDVAPNFQMKKIINEANHR